MTRGDAVSGGKPAGSGPAGRADEDPVLLLDFQKRYNQKPAVLSPWNSSPGRTVSESSICNECEEWTIRGASCRRSQTRYPSSTALNSRIVSSFRVRSRV